MSVALCERVGDVIASRNERSRKNGEYNFLFLEFEFLCLGSEDLPQER